MAYAEFLEELKKIKFVEVRTWSGPFVEVVVKKEILPQVRKVLDRHYGPALKPEGVNPSAEHLEMTSPFGGIWKNQTLYAGEWDKVRYRAMLWPWSDGQTITLKVFQVKTEP